MKRKLQKNLTEFLFQIEDFKQFEDCMKNLLTPEELAEMAVRLEILKQLIEGSPQREIATKLGVSIATITRGSKELKTGPKGIVTVIKNSKWWENDSWR